MNMDKSVEFFQQAQSLFPGGVNSPVRAFRAVGGQPLFIERGEGPYLVDVDGNRYIDYVLSWGPLITGHAHPEVVEAIRQAACRGTSYGATSPLELDLAKSIMEFMPDIEMIRFVNTGTEATMSALREQEIVAERSPLVARKFVLGEIELAMITETGQSLSISFQDVRLIMRGIGIVRGTTTEAVKNRSLSLGRAVMSSGLMITKTAKTVQEVATEERTAFVNIYTGDSRAIVFRENALVYDSLGPALQPSRALNFAYLLAELRRRCTNAQYERASSDPSCPSRPSWADTES